MIIKYYIIKILNYNWFQNCTYIQNPGNYKISLFSKLFSINFNLIFNKKLTYSLKKNMLIVSGFPTAFTSAGTCTYTFQSTAGDANDAFTLFVFCIPLQK